MEKIRLTMFIGKFSIGGGQQMVYELLKKLDKNRIDYEVICYEGKTGTKIENEIESICPVKYMNCSGKVTITKIWKVFKALKHSRPDVIHVHLGGMVYAIPWAIVNSVPLLLTVHGNPSNAFNSGIVPLLKWGLNRRKIYLTAVSEENLLLVQKYFSIFDNRIVCVNNGIDISRFYRSEHNNFTFINVARQDNNKNQAQIIKSFKKVYEKYSDTRLILIGDGPSHSELVQLVTDMGLSNVVELPGIKQDVETYYAVSDVYVQASHREALPMSALEAMAVGLPIISSRVGGMSDIIRGNGLLLQENNVECLADAMILFYEKKNDYSKWQENSRNIVKNYSSEVMAEKFSELYRRIKR